MHPIRPPNIRPSNPERSRQRQRIAREAARLMLESGLRDYRQAGRKAASRLGIHDHLALPDNREIEEARREHLRLFPGTGDVAAKLRQRREAALRAMEFLAAFEPRLVGPVLDGSTDARSPVELHLHEDDPDAVARFLDVHGIPAEARSRGVALDPQRRREFPLWRFIAESLDFELTVLPRSTLRQAPCSTIDGKPMRRASATQLRRLLADGGDGGHD